MHTLFVLYFYIDLTFNVLIVRMAMMSIQPYLQRPGNSDFARIIHAGVPPGMQMLLGSLATVKLLSVGPRAFPTLKFVGKFVGIFVGKFVGIFVGKFVGKFVGDVSHKFPDVGVGAKLSTSQ